MQAPPTDASTRPRKVLVYFAIPFGVSIVLMAMYFSGVDFLQQLITPVFLRRSPDPEREFGILENLQNVILIAMIVLAIRGLRFKRNWHEGLILQGTIALTFFVLLEEIDYGLHWYELLRAIPPEKSMEIRNLHNQGDLTFQSKRIVDLVVVVFFGLLPIGLRRSKIRELLPDPYSILTLFAALFVRTIAHFLRDRGFGESGGLQGNISEFREIVTYYVFLLYVQKIASLRHVNREDVLPESSL